VEVEVKVETEEVEAKAEGEVGEKVKVEVEKDGGQRTEDVGEVVTSSLVLCPWTVGGLPSAVDKAAARPALPSLQIRQDLS